MSDMVSELSNEWRPIQVAAGENPSTSLLMKPTTDISQGREMTPEGGLNNEAPVRAYSTRCSTEVP